MYLRSSHSSLALAARWIGSPAIRRALQAEDRIGRHTMFIGEPDAPLTRARREEDSPIHCLATAHPSCLGNHLGSNIFPRHGGPLGGGSAERKAYRGRPGRPAADNARSLKLKPKPGVPAQPQRQESLTDTGDVTALEYWHSTG